VRGGQEVDARPVLLGSAPPMLSPSIGPVNKVLQSTH
jgi:hypothetical protein